MSHLGQIEAGSRHDLRIGLSPDAPDESAIKGDEEGGAFGYVHSYETSSRYDGPGLRVVLFVSGCLLRCTYCHNPDTWHLKDGTYVSAKQVLNRLKGFAPALQALGGGLTISGGEPMVQMAFTKAILAGAKEMGLHTAIETSGFLGDRADDSAVGAVERRCIDRDRDELTVSVQESSFTSRYALPVQGADDGNLRHHQAAALPIRRLYLCDELAERETFKFVRLPPAQVAAEPTDAQDDAICVRDDRNRARGSEDRVQEGRLSDRQCSAKL